MAKIDFPSSPSINDTFLGSNNINYQWDGEKWKLYVDAYASQASLWSRDSVNADLYPLTLGDDINVRDGDGNIQISVTAEGALNFVTLNIESLPSLP